MKIFFERNKFVMINLLLVMVLSGFSVLMVFVRWVRFDTQAYFFLSWNLFLAWVPLGISVIMYFISQGRLNPIKVISIILLGLVWLLFYPNAPYMLTDYIHFNSGLGLITWYDLTLLSAFILTSLVIGFMSLYLVERIVRKVTNKYIGWLFVVSVLFLSSYGIYMGRFIRHNSWDMVLNPTYIVINFIENISFDSIVFSLIFGSLLSLFYIMLYGLTLFKSETEV